MITEVILTSIVSSGSRTEDPYAKLLIPTVVADVIVLAIPVNPKNWVKFLEVYELIPTVLSIYLKWSSPWVENPTVESTSKIVDPTDTPPIILVLGETENVP